MLQYYGGKQKISRDVANAIAEVSRRSCKSFSSYVELFGGMGSVMLELLEKGEFAQYTLNDVHPAVYRLWKHSKKGWVPSGEISKDKWNLLKQTASTADSPLHAYAGFGCSFGGQYFSGFYERLAKTAFRKLSKTAPKVHQYKSVLKVRNREYRAYKNIKGCVVYCDPPYAYHNSHADSNCYARSGFRADKFWKFARKLSKNNLVFISESEAPSDFRVVWEKTITNTMAKGRTGSAETAGLNKDNTLRKECLFVHRRWLAV